MSDANGRRELAFLGFASPPQGGALAAGEVRLDDEMQRALWDEPPPHAPPPPPPTHAGAQPVRDAAAPPPPYELLVPGAVDEDRHVQFGGADAGTDEPGVDEDEAAAAARRADRLACPPPPHVAPESPATSAGSGEHAQEPHRAEPRTPRRHHLHAPHPGAPEEPRGESDDQPPAAMYDRSPHSVFVQLDELLGESGEAGEWGEAGAGAGEAEWRETARWIKYEEDVEEGSARWGRPHVASLSFHSLLNLRRCLEAGVVLLDLAEKDLPGVAYRVVERMAAEGLLAEDEQPAVLRSLLLRHRHVQHDRGLRQSIGDVAAAVRRRASHASVQSLSDARRRRSSHALPGGGGAEPAGARNKSTAGALDAQEVRALAAAASAAATAAGSQESLRRGRRDSILRRIPEDAEATTVLVGAVDFLARPTIAFVRLARGILMPSITEVPVPVRFMFVLLGPAGADLDYHEVGRSISTLMSNPAFTAIAYRADDRRDLLSAVNEFLDDSIVLPPGDWERQALLPFDELRAKSERIRRRKREALERRRAASPATTAAPAGGDEKRALLAAELGGAGAPDDPDDPLSRTGRLFGGVVRDMRRRYPHYASDFTDALNGQCVAAAVFMYFAALSSAITFGGLLANKTQRQIGIPETLVFTMVGGVVFALVAGQPLMITGATGPLLLLDQALADFCHAWHFDFLVARMYAGLWMLVIALAVAALEGSVAVKRITRFTEDIFAFLISLIFISEPIASTIAVYRNHPLGVDYCATPNATLGAPNATLADAAAAGRSADAPDGPQPNTALFCTVLTISTFAIAYYLRIFRNGKFLGRSARRALGDFGVPIAIACMVCVSVRVPVWTRTLDVPAGLNPSAPRSWLVPLNPGLDTVPAWAAFAMLLPALMVYIIVFMETHIAELIVAKPERKLRKGSGFHMDVVVMSMVNAVCGLFGAPWQCVATVRSVSHVSALTVLSTTHAPGAKPHVVEVKEQRLTGLVVSVLVGASVLASPLLQLVPLAVLFGVFLYMGIAALSGIQFWARCALLLRPVKHHPPEPYVRRVPTLKMHLYTLVQAAGLVVLYAVKSSPLSLALPFFLVLMVPVRMALGRVFTPLELRALDGAQKEIDMDDEPDFHEQAPLPG